MDVDSGRCTVILLSSSSGSLRFTTIFPTNRDVIDNEIR